MKQVIPERHARRQFRWHMVSLVVLLAVIAIPGMPPAAAGAFWLVNAAWLGWNLWQALRLYRSVIAEQG
jgi:hypothetical protein